MASIGTGLAINTATSGDRTTAAGMRKVLASLFAQSAPGVVNSGILDVYGSTPLLVQTNGGSMTYTVKAGFAVINRTNQGVYWLGTLSDQTVTVAAGDPSNPRIDRIYIYQPDPELSDTGVARIDAVQGTPGASPALPSLPTGAFELGRKLVPTGAANTATGTALTNLATKTGLAADWNFIQNLPASFTPASHTLDSHSGLLSLTKGGTGASTRDGARAALGIFVTNTAMTGANAVGDIRFY